MCVPAAEWRLVWVVVKSPGTLATNPEVLGGEHTHTKAGQVRKDCSTVKA